MKLSEILRAGKQRIETIGWGQGVGQVIFGRPNKCCALTAISHQKTSSMEQVELCVQAIDTFKRAAGLASSAEIARWNDAPERTLPEVLAAYDKAISAAEAQEQSK